MNKFSANYTKKILQLTLYIMVLVNAFLGEWEEEKDVHSHHFFSTTNKMLAIVMRVKETNDM